MARHCEEPKATKQSRLDLVPGLDCFRRRPSGYGGHVASLAMTTTASAQTKPVAASTGFQSNHLA
jgi:hypothetical protein